MNRALPFIAFFAMIASGVFAHEMRPAYLELRQTGAETYDVLWKVPGRGDNMRLGDKSHDRRPSAIEDFDGVPRPHDFHMPKPMRKPLGQQREVNVATGVNEGEGLVRT